jgi:imidazolonepropionase-like amidohydrolase
MASDFSSTLEVSVSHPIRWLVVGKLLDARNRQIAKNAHLVYSSKRILYCGVEAPPAIRVAGCARLDLPSFTALPGLIDGHTHIALAGADMDAVQRTAYQSQDPLILLRLALERVQTIAKLGVIAMRDGGDKDGIGFAIKRLSAGTDAVTVSASVSSPGAGIHRRGRYGAFFSRPVEDSPDIDSCVQGRVEAGAEHIKIVPTGIINFAKGAVIAAPQFQTAEIQEFKIASAKRDRHLMAHASGDVGIGYAIDGGADTIEHGYFITDEQLAKMRDQNISWLPTFAPVQEQVDHADIMGWEEPILSTLKRILENHARSFQKALLLGVNVLVGSDAGSWGVAHADGLVREMELMQAAGMNSLDVLCQATFGNCRSLSNNDLIGSLDEGQLPRFILTEHDPLRTVSALHRQRYVVFDGQVFDSDTIVREGL